LADQQPAEEIHHMKDSNIVPLKSPTPEVLGELLKRGAQELLAKAIESEIDELLITYSDNLINGKKAIVRNGYQPERTLQTGLGNISVKVPKVRDRSKQGVKFNSQLVPPYLHRIIYRLRLT
jgi:putative transposase